MLIRRYFALGLVGLCSAGCAQGVLSDEEVVVRDLVFDDERGSRLPDEEMGSDLDVPPTVARAAPVADFVEASQPLGELAACEMLIDALLARGLELDCAVTTHPCPTFMRGTFGEACLLYDAASVHACASTLASAPTCAGLRATSCSVEAIPDSSPLGCP